MKTIKNVISFSLELKSCSFVKPLLLFENNNNNNKKKSTTSKKKKKKHIKYLDN